MQNIQHMQNIFLNMNCIDWCIKCLLFQCALAFTNQCVKSCLNGTESHQAYLQLPVKLTSAFWAIDSKCGHPGHKIKKELHVLFPYNTVWELHLGLKEWNSSLAWQQHMMCEWNIKRMYICTLISVISTCTFTGHAEAKIHVFDS